MARDKITVELQEEDLRKDLDAVMKAMSSIRKENIRADEVSRETKNEYLHLAYRLASLIEKLSDKAMLSNMKTVADHVNKNPALLSYDYSQDKFWNAIEPEFSTSLDSIAIALRGDSFSDIREKHHVLNALKYLGSIDSTPEDKAEIYDKILPFTGNSEIKDRKKILEKNGLKDVKGMDIDGDTLKVDTTKDLEALIKHAGYIGFRKVRVNMAMKEYEALGTKGKVVEKVEKKKKYADFWRKLVKYTKPVSYPIIGSIPHNLRARLADYLTDPKEIQEITNLNTLRVGDKLTAPQYKEFLRDGDGTVDMVVQQGGEGEIVGVRGSMVGTPFQIHFYKNSSKNDLYYYSAQELEGMKATRGHFNTRKAFYWSLGLDAAIIAAGIYAGFGMEQTPGLTVSLGVGIPFTIDLLVRAIRYPWQFGSFLGKALCAPLEDSYDAFPGKEAKGDTYSIEFDTHDTDRTMIKETETRQEHLYQPLLEKLAAKKVGKENEENLVWSRENHHTHGYYFEQRLLSGEKPGFEPALLLRTRNAHSLYNIMESGAYQKISALISRPDERFAVTYISPKEKAAKLEKTFGEIVKEGDFQKNIQDAFKETNAVYMHISRFEKGEKKEDLTITR